MRTGGAIGGLAHLIKRRSRTFRIRVRLDGQAEHDGGDYVERISAGSTMSGPDSGVHRYPLNARLNSPNRGNRFSHSGDDRSEVGGCGIHFRLGCGATWSILIMAIK